LFYVLLAHALRLRHNRRAIEVITSRQELLGVRVSPGFATLQRSELNEGRVGILPIQLDELAEGPPSG
jgi:hypothetical protein